MIGPPRGACLDWARQSGNTRVLRLPTSQALRPALTEPSPSSLIGSRSASDVNKLSDIVRLDINQLIEIGFTSADSEIMFQHCKNNVMLNLLIFGPERKLRNVS